MYYMKYAVAPSHSDLTKICGRHTVNKIVSIDPEILGGTPVFCGTRVPIAVLFENLADGLTLDEILDSYPTLPRELALAALHDAETLLELRKAA
jgi:uncharacterized protein (DUF433 family)